MRIFITLLSALPGAAALLLAGIIQPGEYYRPVLLASAGALALFAAPVAFLLSGRPWFARSRPRAALAVMGGFLAGWLAALLVAGAFNLTPLCVGADNGDGNNTIGMCVFYTLLWAAFYTPPLALIAALSAGLAAALRRPPQARETI